MYYKRIISDNLRQLGRAVDITDGGKTQRVWAVIESRRRKTKTLFEDNSSKAGQYYDDYYTYIGPADFDITALSDAAYFKFGGHRYMLVRCDAVLAAGETVYYEGILKRIWEEEDVFTQ